ncbi:MAG TPA: arylsulfotransferase family protein [Polyangiaceae bacterium]|nr:arylsulfotransferase family protein [Polyangiaceae bacterium]
MKLSVAKPIHLADGPADRRRTPRTGVALVFAVLALASTKVFAQSSTDAGAASASAPPTPPVVTVLQSSPKVARGYIFIAPIGTGSLAIPVSGADAGPPPPSDAGPSAAGPQGPEIIDDEGRAVFFLPLSGGLAATDFRVQSYRGEPVLTYTTGKGFGGLAQGLTTDTILDRSYNVITTVHAGNGLDADQHEFRLTPQGTALITIYNAVPQDLSSVGGPANGEVIDGIVQEIEIATGAVILEWHSLDHVPLSESHQPPPPPTAGTTPYDYFHINAVSIDTDNNLLISSRHTWTVYKLNRRTGDIIWRLGGKSTDFALGPGAEFAWQHNPIAVDADTIRIFDNESNGVPVLPYSRVIWVKRDDASKTATLVQQIIHPDKLSAGSQGGSEGLDNGDTFVGWGAVPRISEFDAQGNLLFDAELPTGYDTYRAYRHEWRGAPSTPPEATAQANGDGTTTVHAIWNGATDVATWTVEGAEGDPHGDLRRLASGEWNGLDTALTFTGTPAVVRVVARDAAGRDIGRSSPVAVAP